MSYNVSRPAALCLLYFVLLVPVALGQEGRKALVRTEKTATGVEQHYIEISTDIPLEQSVYNALSADPQGGPEIGALFSKGNPLPVDDSNLVEKKFPRNRIVVSPEDAAAATRKRFRLYFDVGVDPYADFGDQKYVVNLFNYTTGAGKSARHTIDVGLPLERTPQTDDITCRNEQQLAFFYQFAGQDDASKRRTAELYDWFAGLKGHPADLAKLKVEIEQLNRKGKKDFAVRDLTLAPSRERAQERARFHICFETGQRLPESKFDARVTYADGTPPELFVPAVITGLEGDPTETSPEVFSDESDKSPGQRPLDRNLNFATALTSSVEDKEKEEAGQKLTVRERTTRATLDLRVIPKFIYSYDAERGKDGTKARYLEWIPIFLDSKVSTGKVNKDTLSLNTIVFGTKGEYRHFPRLGRYENYYRFIGGFLNASDRDFKQAEYKGTFEFRPVFGAINHPLVSQETVERKILAPDSKRPLKVIPKNYGFEVVPFIGTELGRTYLRRRPGEGIEPSDAVRRLYFGLDMVLNPVRFMTFSVTDTFYVRSKAESQDDRYRNYFRGAIEIPLGEPTRTPHSVFFSFERGDQPPFKEQGVNALKVGYRLRTDWINLFR
ncbi:MAG: hypothetical protein JOZ02_12820 [Acidobacteria bacterium]|nr:hypothetical protein [Acidobacteriota bacterium]